MGSDVDEVVFEGLFKGSVSLVGGLGLQQSCDLAAALTRAGPLGLNKYYLLGFNLKINND